MKALFISGTGTISTAISTRPLEKGTELWLINRGSRNSALPVGAHIIHADNEVEVAAHLEGKRFSFKEMECPSGA